MRIHSGEWPFRCIQCGKGFDTSIYLLRHLRVHTGERPYTCEDCGRRFAEHTYLREHRRVHTGEKPFECDQCDLAFAFRPQLKRHKFLHTGKRPFTCQECGYGYFKPSDLRIHMRRHTGERPYSCDQCEKQFRSKRTLIQHKSVHTNKKMVRNSKYCGKGFSHRMHLKEPQKKHPLCLKPHRKKRTGVKSPKCDKFSNSSSEQSRTIVQPKSLNKKECAQTIVEYSDLKEEPTESAEHDEKCIEYFDCNIKEEPCSFEDDECKQTIVKCTDLKEEPNSSDESAHEQTIIISNVFSIGDHCITPVTNQ